MDRIDIYCVKIITIKMIHDYYTFQVTVDLNI